jgi:hypothetical protein
MPIPSNAESHTPFFEANASARPKMIQFTTISGIKTPNDAYNAGTYAFISISIMVTNEAITTINAGMRTLTGIRFLIIAINIFERISTAIVATPIPRPFIALVVVPSVGHIPRTNTKVGFSLIIPLTMRDRRLLLILTSFLF